MKKSRSGLPGFIPTVILIGVVAISGYVAMWMLGYYLPNANILRLILVQLGLIAIALGAAYGILKLIFHNARAYDKTETELKLRDLPKDAPKNR